MQVQVSMYNAKPYIQINNEKAICQLADKSGRLHL